MNVYALSVTVVKKQDGRLHVASICLSFKTKTSKDAEQLALNHVKDEFPTNEGWSYIITPLEIKKEMFDEDGNGIQNKAIKGSVRPDKAF